MDSAYVAPSQLGMNEFDDSRYSRSHKGSVHPLSCALSIICPCSWLCSCFTVKEQTEAVLLYFGVYGNPVEQAPRQACLFSRRTAAGIKDTPGIHCSNPCGRDIRTISKRK